MLFDFLPLLLLCVIGVSYKRKTCIQFSVLYAFVVFTVFTVLGLLITFYCRAQQLSLTQYADKENLPVSIQKGQGGSGGGGSFFRKKNALRSKSLGKDHWDTAIFGTYCSSHHNHNTMFGCCVF